MGVNPQSPRPRLYDVYINRRMGALLLLGFGAGLPSIYRLLGSTLQMWLEAVGADVKQLGLATLVGLPMMFNFVWAPLLDRFPPPLVGWLGRRRGWLLLIQAALALTIMGMGVAGPRTTDDPWAPLFVLALLVAFLAASQDVVADAYRTDVLSDAELGAGAGVFVNGYRLGMLLAGAGAIAAAPHIGWSLTYILLGAFMGVGVMGTLLGPPPASDDTPPVTLRDAAVVPFVDFARRYGVRFLAVLAFILFYRLPDSLANPMMVPLLKSELAFSDNQIAAIREVYGMAALMVGLLAGGTLTAKVGLVRALWVYGILQAVTNLGFSFLATQGQSVPAFVLVMTVENFSAGLATAGFIAFLMSRCNRKFSATQYALFTSLMAGAGLVMGGWSGYLLTWLGEDYVAFFAITALFAIPGLAMLPLIPDDRAPAP